MRKLIILPFIILASVCQAAVVVDSFEAIQSLPGSIVDRTIIRDERDLVVAGSASASIGGGTVAMSLDASSKLTLEYDGSDVQADLNDPSTYSLMGVGLGVMDLTEAGNSNAPAFQINVLALTGSPQLTIQIEDFGGGTPPDPVRIDIESTTLNINSTGIMTIPLSGFVPMGSIRVDRKAVRAIRLDFTAAGPASLEIGELFVSDNAPSAGVLHSFPTPELALPNPVQHVVAGLPSGASPQGIAYFGVDDALVADHGNSRIFRINPDTGTLINTIDTSVSNYDGSGSIAIAPDLATALAAGGNDTLHIFSAPFQNPIAVKTLKLPGTVPAWQAQAITFARDGRAFIYHDAGISVLSPPTYASVDFTLSVPPSPLIATPPVGALALTSDGSRLLATGVDTIVRIFSAPFSSASIAGQLDLNSNGAQRLDGIAVMPDDSEALIVDSELNDRVFSVQGPFSPASTVTTPALSGFLTGFEQLSISSDGALYGAGGGVKPGKTDSSVLLADAVPQAVTLTAGVNRGGGSITLQPVGLAPGLKLTKLAPSTVTVGDPFVYTLTYENTATGAANNVVIRDKLPLGTTFVSADSGGVLQGDTVVWNIGNIAGNSGPASVSFTATANIASVIINDSALMLADGVSTVAAAPVLTASSVLPPVATSDSYSVGQNGILNVTAASGVLNNDRDPLGIAMQALELSLPGNGSFNLHADGGFDYTPNRDFTGLDSFIYMAYNGSLSSAPVTVLINVLASNSPPVLGPDAYFMPQDGILVAQTSLLANDTDPENSPLTAKPGSSPAKGHLALLPSGFFTYTPDAGFSGIDSFTYIASDGSLDSPAGMVLINVQANLPPIAQDDSYFTTQDTMLQIPATGILTNDLDPEGHALFAVIDTQAGNGVVTLIPGGGFNYMPNAGFSGLDSFTYFANDGAEQSASAMVVIAVAADNQPPVAGPDSYSMVRDTTLTVPPNGLLANDHDPEGNPLYPFILTNPASGLLHLTGGGGFTYTPNPGFTGIDTFTYQANDGHLPSASTLVTITVDDINKPPSALDDTYTVSTSAPKLDIPAPGLLVNDSDPEGHALTAVLLTNTASLQGNIIVNSDGSATFTLAAGVVAGTASFSYLASDGELDSAPATVTINIIASNNAPVAVADSFSVPQDTLLSVTDSGILSNDSDPDGDLLNILIDSTPANGILHHNPGGGFTYTPNTGFSGTDSFTYHLNDGQANSETVAVTLTVTHVVSNSAPTLTAPTGLSITADHALQVAAPGLLAGATDPDGDTLRVVVVALPVNGSLHIDLDGGFTYRPNPGFVGIDSFQILVTDGALDSNTVNVAIEAIRPVVTTQTIAVPALSTTGLAMIFLLLLWIASRRFRRQPESWTK